MRVQSPQPIFFRQWCVGERGKLFRLFKFRTGLVNAQTLEHEVMGNQKSLQKHEDGKSITPLGLWMRKYSLDKLPQLFNVLRGEISLMGPRPWTLYDAVRLSPEERRMP
jgi:lipopolysaccharide/colanic/teichoic acid biosynthesis glycosyltransferase